MLRQLYAVTQRACLPSEIAFRSVGLHAARRKTPHMTLVGRLAFAGAQASLTPPNRCPLVKAPFMRSTLHYVLDEEFAELHSATLDYRIARRHRSLRRLGFDDGSIPALRLNFIDLMPEREVSEEELFDLARKALEHVGIRWRGVSDAHVAWQLCRLLWDNGDIRMTNAASSWRGEQRWFRVWDTPRIEQRDAVNHLVLRYVAAYGPVSLKDIAWWSALGAKLLRSSLDDLLAMEKIVAIDIAGRTLYAMHDDVRHPVIEPTDGDPVYLAYEDPFIKAYFDTRDRYASPYALSRLFHSTGEAKACVLIHGRVRGVWEAAPQGEFAHLTLCPALSRAERERAIEMWERHLSALYETDPRREVMLDVKSYQ
ncbi:DNA glycosylase AlkZ-like family protein [Burkholderia stagnalis]|uniref:DNA glycosylase AlkZ-like family protein n=1 Tax=Burkholderia stagnalis TaxID=1503054 RepID=UPI002407C197|nr:crosslink repair DNA glycosylase YcaQ family protein [Burkholderia stagnalis]